MFPHAGWHWSIRGSAQKQMATETADEQVVARLRDFWLSLEKTFPFSVHYNSSTLKEEPGPLPQTIEFAYHFDLAVFGSEFPIPEKTSQFTEIFYDTEDGLFLRNNVWISERLDPAQHWYVKGISKVGNVLQVSKIEISGANSAILGDYIREVVGLNRRREPDAVSFDSGVGPDHYLTVFARSITTRHHLLSSGKYWVDVAHLKSPGNPVLAEYRVATISMPSLAEISHKLASLQSQYPLQNVPGKAAAAAHLFRRDWTQDLDLTPVHVYLGRAEPPIFPVGEDSDSYGSDEENPIEL